MSRIVPVLAALLLTLSCAKPREDGNTVADGGSLPPIGDTADTEDTEGDDDESSNGDKLDVGSNETEGAADEGGDECDPDEPNATLRGTVVLPRTSRSRSAARWCGGRMMSRAGA